MRDARYLRAEAARYHAEAAEIETGRKTQVITAAPPINEA